jgi:hypothetical protein
MTAGISPYGSRLAISNTEWSVLAGGGGLLDLQWQFAFPASANVEDVIVQSLLMPGDDFIAPHD